MLLLLLACAPTDDAPPTNDEAPSLADLPTGGCGMRAYDWVPLDQMGAVVSADAADDLSISAATIDYLLTSYGYGAYTPVPYDVKAWRVRYVTQDKGLPVEATMVLALPDTDQAVPLMIAPHGTSGFTDACAPSAGGLEENGFDLIFASLGYAVAAPDYLGMNGFGAPSGMLHPYLVPEATAVATLDAGRAALRFVEEEQAGASIDAARTVLWGGSEGGFAALWAERYQPAYLPEITVVGTAALVPPTDLTGIALAGLTAPIPASAALVAGWIGQHSWYGAADASLDDVLVAPIAEALPGEMLTMCEDFPSMASVDALDDLFTPAALAAGQAGTFDGLGPWGCYLSRGDLADTTIPRTSDAPVLVVVGEQDDLVVADTVRASIADLCADGYDIEYLECDEAGHTDAAVESLPYQLDWLAARVRGDSAASATCVVGQPVTCAAR